MKKAVFLGMAALLLLGWTTTIKSFLELPAQYREKITQAEVYESEKIYIRAIECYKEALKYQPDSIEIKARIAEDYLKMEDEVSFVNQCNSIHLEHKYPVSLVSMQADYYIERKQEKKAIELLENAMKYHKNASELLERYEKLRYTFSRLYLRYDEIKGFRNNSAVVLTEDLYGLIDTKGNRILKCNNQWVGAFSDDGQYIPVLKDGEYFYADNRGNRIEVPSDGQKIEALGVLCQGVAPAKINGKYGYINEEFKELTSFVWDDATVIRNGIGAVKQGKQWAVINDSYDTLTDYEFDDIKTDEHGYCSISGRIFAKCPDGYILLNENGKQEGELIFQDARPFLTEQPAAVCVEGKWGFVDKNGKFIIEPQYEAADSFSQGLAPVCIGMEWGYINEKNELVITAEYSEARSFYKGVAPVKIGNSWTVIELNMNIK